MKHKPNLSVIVEVLREDALDSFNEGDAAGVFSLAAHQDRGRLLLDNLEALLERGMYERALFQTYVHGPHMRPEQWLKLFRIADRARMHSCGERLPDTELKVYRGIRCTRFRGWIRGLSWTTEPGIAAWFSERYAHKGDRPAVYSVKLLPEDIFFITNGRGEKEVVAFPPVARRLTRMKKMPATIRPTTDG